MLAYANNKNLMAVNFYSVVLRAHSKVPLMGSNQNFFVFNPILMKLGEVVVSMGTTTSPSFIKIRLKTKKF